ncbi:hypothetical protein [Chryseobacterium wanjuense]
MRKKVYSLITSVVLGYTISAQVGIKTSDPQGSLDVAYISSNPSSPQGILFPRMTGDEIQAMSVTSQQNGLFVFATTVPTSQIPRTSLITESGLYYYFFPDDKWRNVNQIINPSSLFSTNYRNTNVTAIDWSEGDDSNGYNTPGKTSYIIFEGGTEVPFNNSPYVIARAPNPLPRRGLRFLKSGIYSVSIQFTFVYDRDVTGDGANDANLPDRSGSQITFQMTPNFLNSPTSAYTSNITHNIDYQPSRQGSGRSRISGIATGNIIIKQDNVVEFIPQIWTSGYWLTNNELTDTGFLNMHVTRVSDYTP